MRLVLVISVVLGLMAACAHQDPKTDAPATAAPLECSMLWGKRIDDPQTRKEEIFVVAPASDGISEKKLGKATLKFKWNWHGKAALTTFEVTGRHGLFHLDRRVYHNPTSLDPGSGESRALSVDPATSQRFVSFCYAQSDRQKAPPPEPAK